MCSEKALALAVLAQIPGMGPGRLTKLLSAHCDDPGLVWQADWLAWQRVGVPREGYECHLELGLEQEKTRLRRQLREQATGLICPSEPGYPSALNEIACPPQVLFYQGDLSLAGTKLCLAIIGTRKATQLGLNIATDLSFSLAEAGVVIVSGLAKGIDGAAHKGALAAKGKTIAVLGGGFANIYPGEHRSLAEGIIRQGGLLLSEYPPYHPAHPRQFIARNRIISGLSKGVVVVEAPSKSGALITAELALEQNREVWVVPGNIHQANWAGSNHLIQQGAGLITGVEDIFQSLALLNFNLHGESGCPQFSEAETAIFKQIVNGAETIETLLETIGISLGTVSYAISNLQLRKFITVSIDGRLLPGPLWSKALSGLQNEEGFL